MRGVKTDGSATRATLNLWPETARILGLGRNAVYAAAHRGDIPTVRIGGRLLVPKAALDRMLMLDGEENLKGSRKDDE